MAEVPDIVRSKLGKQSSGDAGHPDANLLAAFAEQELPGRERETVLAHLAECADCREYLALAFAAPEAQTIVALRPAARAGQRWFLEWRWVGAAAAACCVVAVALQYGVEPLSPPKSRQLAGTMMTPGNVQPASEQGVRMSTEAADSKPKMERSNIRQGEAAILFMKKASPQQRRAFEASPQPGGLAAQTELSAPPALSPSLNITLPPKTEAEALPKYAAEAMTHVKDAIPQPRNTVSPMQGSTLAARSNRFAQAIVPSAPAASMRAIVAGPAPAGVLWSIGTSPATTEKPRGVVERSMDSGKTWEVVPLDDGVSFRSVAAAGPEVWAGGSQGALFHSLDGGSRWERITVSDSNGKLTGTIRSIDAKDSGRLKVTTSSGESWLSVDGGRHWTRM